MLERLRRPRLDSGFTLIEMVVALGIAMVIFLAMAAATLSSIRATVVSRQNQGAVDVLNRVLEEARAVPFAGLAMATSDLAVNDDAISTSPAPATYVVPNGIGAETVVHEATGAINPHVTTTDSAGGAGATYTVKRYVTLPADSVVDSSGLPSQKRLTVVATWNTYGTERTRVISTIITESIRGLPLPRYVVRPSGVLSQTKNPGSSVTWGFRLSNLGARDTFNLTASSGTWEYYRDPDCNGVRDAGEDIPLTNTDAALGDADVDTGPVETNNVPPFCITATRAIGASESGTSEVTFQFESSAQPDAATAQMSSPTYTLNVQTGAVGGGGPTGPTANPDACPAAPGSAVQGTATTLTQFGFNNGTAATPWGSTSSQAVSVFAQGLCPRQDQDYNFSTEAGAGIGRVLQSGGSASTGTSAQLAEWRWNPPGDRTVNGTAAVSLQVSCVTAGPSVTLNAAVGSYREKDGASDSWTSKGTESTTVSCATANTWGPATITVPLTSFLVKNKYQGQPEHLSLRLWTSGAGVPAIRFNYAAPSAQSFLTASVG